MEIVAKFGAAMKGFWWGLEDEERMMLVSAILYGVAIFVGNRMTAQAKERDRRELAMLVAEELRRD